MFFILNDVNSMKKWVVNQLPGLDAISVSKLTYLHSAPLKILSVNTFDNTPKTEQVLGVTSDHPFTPYC